jgi:hypothetical protein
MPRLLGDKLPAYRKHRATGQAVVTLSGRDFYLGHFGTATSKAEYDRRVGEWKAAGDLTSTRSARRLLVLAMQSQHRIVLTSLRENEVRKRVRSVSETGQSANE